MRRVLAPAVLLALLAVAVTGVALAAGERTTSGSDKARLHVIRVHRVPGEQKILDLDRSATANKPAPDSIGDEDVENGFFYRGKQQVGFDGVVCTLVRLPSWYQCVATNVFPRGSITVQFLADFSSNQPGHFAITGGTGAYRGARGEVTYVATSNGEADVTMRFTTSR